MEKHVEDWKRTIVNGKVHSETEISVIKHTRLLGGFGLHPTTHKETLLWPDEREDSQVLVERGGFQGGAPNQQMHKKYFHGLLI